MSGLSINGKHLAVQGIKEVDPSLSVQEAAVKTTKNGINEINETGLSGVTVHLYKDDDNDNYSRFNMNNDNSKHHDGTALIMSVFYRIAFTSCFSSVLNIVVIILSFH